MRHLVLIALGILPILAGCAHEPYKPVTAPPPVSLKPIRETNVKLKEGNQKIGASIADAQESLKRLQADFDTEKFNKEIAQNNLNDAIKALDEAQKAKISQDATIELQNQVITQKDQEIDKNNQFTTNLVNERNKIAQENADLNKLKEEVNKYWGFGGILYGLKRLGWRVLILVVLLTGVGIALNFLAPGVRPILSMILKGLAYPFKLLWAKLKPKPPA